MRVGQKNKLTYRWARKGSRPRAAHDQRTQSTYLFGAVCPEHGTGAALVLPFCNTEAMQLHLDEIAAKVTAGAHAILILDQAGWHGAKELKIPGNISLLQLPPRAPELNSQENIWQFLRQNWLSNRIFKSFDDVVEGFEDTVRQPVLSHELPDIFLAIELRCTRRQLQERYLAGNLKFLGAVPAGLIEDKDRVGACGYSCSDLIDMKLHGFGVAER